MDVRRNLRDSIPLIQFVTNAKVMGDHSCLVPDLLQSVFVSGLCFAIVTGCEDFVLLTVDCFIEHIEEMGTSISIIIYFSQRED